MAGNLWWHHKRSAAEPRAHVACRPVLHNAAPLLVSNVIRHIKRSGTRAMSRSKRARRFHMDDDEARVEPAAIDPFSPSLLLGRLRAVCAGDAGDVGFLQTLAKGAYITAGDPATLCATLVAIYEPLWTGLVPIYATFPVLYGLLGRPPTPTSVSEAVGVLAPDLVADAAIDPVGAVWRAAAATDARRWTGVPSDEWLHRVGPGAFEGLYEARAAMAPHEARRQTMADLVRSASITGYDNGAGERRYHVAATRDARGLHPVMALLLANGAVVASLACRRPPDAARAIDCAMDIARHEGAVPADVTPYVRDLLGDDRAVGALLQQFAVPAAFGGRYGPSGALLRDLWDISPVARPALLDASGPGARWLVAELDEHQLVSELDTERNIERVGSHLAPLARETPTLAARSARALSRGPASRVLLADMTAPVEVKALIAAQRIAQRCGNVLTPDDVSYLVDAANALGLDGEILLQLLGPYDLCRHAVDAAAQVLERHRSMALAD
ncbi:hypothetical protein pdul_cds_810 [Pandoravirus dulcis]|uniref:DUF5848 domain-containing protein n=1 Tax=Pandoravirus dulcis TaxID=1349409 RepID=S4VUE4_9VIRU|nr:hypothetical protein pdul_cds_810 [Pandoravirus dulcis]AGO83015.1 hypothetical protein pdul_cds_810 [Pandoravirus dulcis]